VHSRALRTPVVTILCHSIHYLLRIFREDIKSGKNSAHENVESAYARAFANSSYTKYIGLDGATGGTNQASFLGEHDSYEAIHPH
jgi:hypothetical protein